MCGSKLAPIVERFQEQRKQMNSGSLIFRTDDQNRPRGLFGNAVRRMLMRAQGTTPSSAPSIMQTPGGFLGQ